MPDSVLNPNRKPWTRTAEATADLLALTGRRAAEESEQQVAAAVTAAIAAERDAEYARFLPALNRKTLPAYVAAIVPDWARERHAREQVA